MAKASAKIAPAPAPFEPDHNFLRAVLEGERTIGHLFTSPSFTKPYEDEGLVESNHDIRAPNGDLATRLTDEGRELIGANGAEEGDEENEGDDGRPYGSDEGEVLGASLYELDDDIPIPGKRRRVRKEKFPFDKMEVGKSFHVPKDSNKDLKEMLKGFASTVSAANSRFAVPTGEQEQATISTYETDNDGKRVKRNGHYVKTGQKVITRDKMRREREFSAYIASPDDPRGAGIRVFRVK